MSGKKVINNCYATIKSIVDDLGYVLVDLDYKKLITGMTMIVTIDSPNGIMLEDCEKVHRAIDGPLDELDPTDGVGYHLNVSSMGLDRPLKTDYELNKYKDKLVSLKFFAPFEKKKTMQGTLKSHTDKIIEIEVEQNIKNIEREKIATITPVIEF